MSVRHRNRCMVLGAWSKGRSPNVVWPGTKASLQEKGPTNLDGLRVEVPGVVGIHEELPWVRIARVACHAVAQHEDNVVVRDSEAPQSSAV